MIDFGYSCFGATDEDLVRLPFTEGWSAPEWDDGEFHVWKAKKADIYTFALLCKWILERGAGDFSEASNGETRESLRKMFELGLDRDPENRPKNIQELLILLDHAAIDDIYR